MRQHILAVCIILSVAGYGVATGGSQDHSWTTREKSPPQQAYGQAYLPCHEDTFGNVYLPLGGEDNYVADDAVSQAAPLDPRMYSTDFSTPYQQQSGYTTGYDPLDPYPLPPSDFTFPQQTPYQHMQGQGHYYGEFNPQLSHFQPALTTHQAPVQLPPSPVFSEDSIGFMDRQQQQHTFQPNILESDMHGVRGQQGKRVYDLPPDLVESYAQSQKAARARASVAQRQRLADNFWEGTSQTRLGGTDSSKKSALAAIRTRGGRQQLGDGGSGSMTARLTGERSKGKQLAEPRSARLPPTSTAIDSLADEEANEVEDDDDKEEDPFGADEGEEENLNVRTYRAGTQEAHDHRLYTRWLIKDEWKKRRLSFRRIPAEEMARQFIEIKMQNPGYEQSIGKQISHIVRKATEEQWPEYKSDFMKATNTFTDRINYLRKKYVRDNPGATLADVPAAWVLDDFNQWLEEKQTGKVKVSKKTGKGKEHA